MTTGRINQVTTFSNAITKRSAAKPYFNKSTTVEMLKEFPIDLIKRQLMLIKH